jgi:hypothetical protein
VIVFIDDVVSTRRHWGGCWGLGGVATNTDLSASHKDSLSEGILCAIAQDNLRRMTSTWGEAQIPAADSGYFQVSEKA